MCEKTTTKAGDGVNLLGGNASKDQVSNTPSKQHSVDVGAPEAPFPWLVDDSLPGPRRQLFDDVVAIFTPDEKSTHRALVANADAMMTTGSRDLAKSLGRRQVGQIWLVAFAGMDNMPAKGSEGIEDSFDGGHNGACF